MSSCIVADRVRCTTCLEEADSQASPPIYAIQFVRFAVATSRNNPGLFLCKEGAQAPPVGYWIKVVEPFDHCLISELIAGRLGQRTGLAPGAAIVQVTEAAIAGRQELERFRGTGVGVRDQAGTQNSRDLALFVGNNQFNKDLLDHDSWTATTVFQAWIGMSDLQALVCLKSGHVYSFDHEESVARQLDNRPVISEFRILDVPLSKTANADAALRTVTCIEAITDREILETVSMVRMGLSWQPDASFRVQIASRLAGRRDNLRPAVEEWLRQ